MAKDLHLAHFIVACIEEVASLSIQDRSPASGIPNYLNLTLPQMPHLVPLLLLSSTILLATAVTATHLVKLP